MTQQLNKDVDCSRIRWQRAEIFEVRKGAVALTNPEISAQLLSRSAYWGNSPAERAKGLQHEFRPFVFNGKETYFDATRLHVRVLFVLGGDIGEISFRYDLAATGQLYCDRGDFRRWYRELQMRIADSIERARKDYGTLKYSMKGVNSGLVIEANKAVG